LVEVLKGWLVHHWKVLGLALIAILALSTGVYANWRLNTQPASEQYSIAVSPPLELRLGLDKTQFLQNETVVIRLSLRNISNQTITMLFANTNDKIGFTVKDADDRVIFTYPGWVYPLTEEVILKPGDQITQNWRDEAIQWHQVRAVRELLEPPFEEPVSLGTYKIMGTTGSMGVQGYQLPEKIETPPIIITISLKR
jgi:hypothetical protein